MKKSGKKRISPKLELSLKEKGLRNLAKKDDT
jgi:hypothetical protein